jgi:N-acetylmuramoyl-L-alanine amidase
MMKRFVPKALLLVFLLALASCTTRSYRVAPIAEQPIIQRKHVEAHVKKPIQALTKAHIVLDAGHGGKDTGALSAKKGYEEKERTLLTARIVKNYLEELGYRVTLTRTDDAFVSLPKRAEIANNLKANLFVSLHYNYCENSEAHGIEIFYYKDEKNPFSPRILASKRLGEEVLARITKHTGAYARGVKKANFAVIRETTMPAILIEGGFLSNPDELHKIKEESYLCYLGWAIARGVESYLESTAK